MMRARVHRGRRAGRRTTKATEILARLEPQESSVVLASLLAKHPMLADEAELIARAVVASVEAGTVAEEVEQAVMGVDMEEMGAHSGRKSWGYVEPTDAAWELLEDTLEPFLVQMKRLVELGLENAAGVYCEGMVLGLYRCRGSHEDLALAWAQDFPLEGAGNAVSALRRACGGGSRRGWRPSAAFFDQVPEWSDRLKRAAR